MTATATLSPDTAPKLASVRGVEIFAAGEHREGKLYTTADLDRMCENFKQLQDVLKPPVVIGHSEDQSWLEDSGIPAAGRVEELWREGDTLLANFAEVPQSIARLINGRAYRAVSAEVYDDFEGPDGKHHGKALRRVALLGGELPQIKTLADLPLADYAERAARTARLEFKSRLARPLAGTFVAFSEVKVMAKRNKLAKFSDKTKAAWKKFAEEQVMPEVAGPAPAGVTRDDMMAMLTEYGFDPAALEKIPDEGLAEIVRVYKSSMGGMAGEAQPGTLNAEPPITPPITPAPVPAPAPAPIPGVPDRTPSQVTLKFGEKDVQLNEILTPIVNAAVAAATKPIQEKLSAAEQSVEKFQEATKRASIDAELDVLLKQGKVLPAEIDAGLREQLYRANAVQKFSDGKTELDKQLDVFKARPQILKLSEQVRAGKGGASGTGDDELLKVQRYAESDQHFGRALERLGKTPAVYVEEFKTAKAKIPGLTAKAFGVPDQYLN